MRWGQRFIQALPHEPPATGTIRPTAVWDEVDACGLTIIGGIATVYGKVATPAARL